MTHIVYACSRHCNSLDEFRVSRNSSTDEFKMSLLISSILIHRHGQRRCWIRISWYRNLRPLTVKTYTRCSARIPSSLCRPERSCPNGTRSARNTSLESSLRFWIHVTIVLVLSFVNVKQTHGPFFFFFRNSLIRDESIGRNSCFSLTQFLFIAIFSKIAVNSFAKS